MARFDGKVAVVTGGGSGIGKKTAELFAAEGGTVVVTDINEENGKTAAAELGDNVHFLAHDVTDEASWDSVLSAIVGAHGKIDILVNNAGGGVGRPDDIERADLDTFRGLTELNLDSVFIGCHAAIPVMRESGGGSIVNISSMAGLFGVPNMMAYGAAKAGVWSLSRTLALHCARRGYNIRCNSVHPTFIETPLTSDLIEKSKDPERARQRWKNSIPLRRLGKPEDIGYAVLYLASDDASFVTGTAIPVDGGTLAV